MDGISFTFEIHYGGTFVWNPNLEYVGGNVETIYNIDPDKHSYFEIQAICLDLGTLGTSSFHYLIPGGNLVQGLRLINGDDDVVYMCELHAN